MMKQKPEEIWKEYERAVDYKNAIDLFENVRVNENFFIGRQWEGVNAPDLPKPVLNFLKRIVTYSVAMVVSDDVAVSFSPMKREKRLQSIAALAAEQVERVIEQTDAKTLHREKVRDAAVDGDGCVYLWFDPDVDTGQDAKGDIRIESIENINLHPGNPYIHSMQDQPYIIISKRQMVEEVVEEAKQNGIGEDVLANIRADTDYNQGEKGDDSRVGECARLVTVLIKLWRENGTIHALKCTEKAMIKPAWDTEYKYYPVALMRWEKVKSQFFGNAMLNGLIQNQISVNRLFAMTIRSVEMNAFPKVIYDSTKIRKWSNRVGEAIAATGAINEQIMTNVRGGDVSGQVMNVINEAVNMTRDFMGATDAALGNVRPDNTSAIIAVQQASAVPLELQRREFYRFVEEYVRIIVDMMRVNYGVRTVMVDDPELIQKLLDPNNPQEEGVDVYPVEIDFADILKDANMQLNVDVGAAAYWSELMQNQVMDNLFKSGLLTDVAVYIESIPSHMLKNKNKILAAVKRRQDAARQQSAARKQGELQAMLEQQGLLAQKAMQQPNPPVALATYADATEAESPSR